LACVTVALRGRFDEHAANEGIDLQAIRIRAADERACIAQERFDRAGELYAEACEKEQAAVIRESRLSTLGAAAVLLGDATRAMRVARGAS
jgi:hypothetical protein